MKRTGAVTRKSIAFRIFRVLLIPIVIVFGTTLFLNDHYRRQIEQQTIQDYSRRLSSLADRLDSMVEEIVRNVDLFSGDPDVLAWFMAARPLPSTQFYRAMGAVSALSKFAQTKALVDDVYLYVPAQSLVISASGTFPADRFFNAFAVYDRYPYDYWLSNRDARLVDSQSLGPTDVTTVSPGTGDRNTRPVVPFVFHRIGSFYSWNLLVVNVSLREIARVLREDLVSEGGALFVFDSSRRLLASTVATDTDAGRAVGAPRMYGGSQVMDWSYQGAPAIAIRYQPASPGEEQFSFLAVVPTTVIRAEALRLSNVVFILALLGLGISIIAAALSSMRIYSPIRQLVAILERDPVPGTTDHAYDDYEFLRTKVRLLLDSNRTLSDELDVVAPIVREQYLIRDLNNIETGNEEEARKFLEERGLRFPGERFVVAIAAVDNIPDVDDRPSGHSLLSLHAGMARLVTRSIGHLAHAVVVHLDNTTIGVVCNLRDAGTVEQLERAFREIVRLFATDMDGFRIHVGIGRVGIGRDGMQASYREAFVAVARAAVSGHGVALCAEEDKSIRSVYTIEDEYRLHNYLASGEASQAADLVRTILAGNVGTGNSPTAMRELLIQLYLTGLRVLYALNQNPSAVLGDDYHTILEMSTRPELELSVDRVQRYFERIASVTASGRRKIDAAALLSFVDTHFRRPLYLEDLARHFGTTDKYVSRVFRKTVGVPFYRYLETRRIDLAKAMLTEDALPVTQIAEACGFTNRNTFLRIFRKLTGVAPSVYKRQAQPVEPS